MSQSPSSPPRRFRWQLSLRMLLLLMALVGIGLTVYRWPWVESKWHDVMATAPPVDPFGAPGDPFGSSFQAPKLLYRYEQRTTYRRNWRAQAVKNGVEQFWRDGRLWHESDYYAGKLHGARRVYDAQGKATYEVHFHHGQYHGPAFCRAGNDFKWKGEFINGKPDGPWQATVSYQSQFEMYDPTYWVEFDHPECAWTLKAPVRVLTNWNHGKRHGMWTWKLLDEGAVIRTVEYVRGDLQRWNGEPVVEQFLTRLKENPDEDGVQGLLRIIERAGIGDCRVGYPSGYGNWGVCFAFERNGAAVEKFFVHGVNFPRDSFTYDGVHFTPALCEFAAKSNCRLEYRYGGLLFVPSDAYGQPFVDPTGFEDVKFEAGSPQERDWAAVIDVSSSSSSGCGCVQELLRSSSIGLEVDQDWIFQYPDASLNGKLLFSRRRCDAIGLVCYLGGLRCTQHGNKLILARAPGQTADQALGFPLQPPIFPEPRCYR